MSPLYVNLQRLYKHLSNGGMHVKGFNVTPKFQVGPPTSKPPKFCARAIHLLGDNTEIH